MDKSAMRHTTILVRADWDDEAGVWVATSDDLKGLVTEAETLEELRTKVFVMAGELVDLGGLPGGSDLLEIPVHIMAETTGRIRNPRPA